MTAQSVESAPRPTGTALPASLQVLEFAAARAPEIGAVESLLAERGGAGSAGVEADNANLLPVSCGAAGCVCAPDGR